MNESYSYYYIRNYYLLTLYYTEAAQEVDGKRVFKECFHGHGADRVLPNVNLNQFIRARKSFPRRCHLASNHPSLYLIGRDTGIRVGALTLQEMTMAPLKK